MNHPEIGHQVVLAQSDQYNVQDRAHDLLSANREQLSLLPCKILSTDMSNNIMVSYPYSPPLASESAGFIQ